MKLTVIASAALLACASVGAADPAASSKAGVLSERKLAQVTPGKSTKAQIQALLGTPWRIVQFNDCGHAPSGQSDETWDYRGADAHGSYRLHIEFGDSGVVHLVAKIPDVSNDGKGTVAITAPGAAGSMDGMSM
jgi:outer membrane protein assembly factor BamE (lipoprotein component of BamABCDE complex)